MCLAKARAVRSSASAREGRTSRKSNRPVVTLFEEFVLIKFVFFRPSFEAWPS
jgi:hypothetical protein